MANSPKPPRHSVSPTLVTVQATAEALQVSEETVRNLIHADEIRAVRIGRQFRISLAELERLTGAGLQSA